MAMKVNTGPLSIAPQKPLQVSLEERLAWVKKHWATHRDVRTHEMARLHKEIFAEPIDLKSLETVKSELDEPEPPEPEVIPLDLELDNDEPEEEPSEEDHKPPTKPATVNFPDPGTTRSRRDSEIRSDYVVALMKQKPTISNAEIGHALVSKFGIQVDMATLCKLRKKLGIGRWSKKKHRVSRETPPAPPPRRQAAAPVLVENEAAILNAIQELTEELPQLQYLKVWREAGQPVFEYELASVVKGKGAL